LNIRLRSHLQGRLDPCVANSAKMMPMTRIVHYFSRLPKGRIVLWCYLIWYLSTVLHHFDSSPSIWLNSVGISAFIGIALILSVGGTSSALADRWQTFRLFAMPFCVSSYSSLIKGKGFMFIFPPAPDELVTSGALCVCFVVLVTGLRKMSGEASACLSDTAEVCSYREKRSTQAPQRAGIRGFNTAIALHGDT
jgi:hypothetical protein